MAIQPHLQARLLTDQMLSLREDTMAISISTQNADVWKMRVQIPGLAGATYMCQQSGNVWVSASADHQPICQQVLGSPTGNSSQESYIRWDNVQSTDLVELLIQLDNV